VHHAGLLGIRVLSSEASGRTWKVRGLAPEVSSRVRQASEEVETSGLSPRCLGRLVFCSRGEQRYSGRYVSRRTLGRVVICLSVVSAMVSGGHLPCK
jgi:hypothetical protein